ncbi:MAG: hypothetical protein PH343_08880 [Nitrospira sp.]|nr:hypothetical protein [Nitrospira sp.]
MKFDYAIETLENRIKDWQGSMQYDDEKTTEKITKPRIAELRNAIEELKKLNIN